MFGGEEENCMSCFVAVPNMFGRGETCAPVTFFVKHIVYSTCMSRRLVLYVVDAGSR